MDFEQHIYGMTEEGEAVIIYILRAESGAEVHLTNYGASVIAIKTPDIDGKLSNVVLSQADLPTMMRDRSYLGRTVDWSVALRSIGLHNSIWESRFETNRVVMSYVLEGDENLSVEAIFDFDDDLSLEVTYLAKSDLDISLDISPNIYLNLSGNEDSSVGDHELKINSDDFRTLDSLFSEVGMEHDFTKEGYKRGILSYVAELRDPKSRRSVELLTSKEGLNLYRGDRQRSIALTPRSITTTELKAGELYCEKMVYKFSNLR